MRNRKPERLASLDRRPMDGLQHGNLQRSNLRFRFVQDHDRAVKPLTHCGVGWEETSGRCNPSAPAANVESLDCDFGSPIVESSCRNPDFLRVLSA